MDNLFLDNQKISLNSKPFIIAEAGINHNGNINTALRMIEVAKEIGASAIKFQTFKATDFCGDKNQKITYFSNNRKYTENMLELFKRHEFTKSQWKDIKKKCDNEKIIFFSTPQNINNLKFLLNLGVKIIKIGSDDFVNHDLILSAKNTNLPVILSCGMASEKEIIETINLFDLVSNPLVLCLCTSEYPAKPNSLNLSRILKIKKLFPDLNIGYSDHSIGSSAAIVSLSYGARVFEKHFTLNNDFQGPDHWFSENPTSFQRYISDINNSFKMIGSSALNPSKNELTMQKLARRRILAKKNLKKNTTISKNNVSFKRAGKGLFINDFEKIKGKKVNISIKKNEPLLKKYIYG